MIQFPLMNNKFFVFASNNKMCLFDAGCYNTYLFYLLLI